METKDLREIVMEMSDHDVRWSLFSLATQLEDGEVPSIWNLVALIAPEQVAFPKAG